MAIEQGLFQLIQTDAGVSSAGVTTTNGQGVYWILAPKNATLPNVILGWVTQNDTYTMEGAIDFREGILQVDCYSSTYYGSRAIASAVRDLLKSYQGTLPDADSTVVNAVFITKDYDMAYEEGASNIGFIYRAMLEFRIWYRDTA